METDPSNGELNMISDYILKIGDKVTVKIDKERRAWSEKGYPFPDGAEGVICGFYDSVRCYGRVGWYKQKPGIFHKRGAVSVILQNGYIATGLSGGIDVELVDKAEAKRREDEARKTYDKHGGDHTTYLGDLPPTKFWEGDKVIVKATRGALVISAPACPRMPEPDKFETFIVQRVDHDRIHEKCNDGSPWPIYQISDKFGSGWHTSAAEADMELVERGNVWKRHHNEPLSFESLEDEATFYQLIGEFEEIPNPASGYYDWTKDQALEAIRRGDAHALSVSPKMFRSGMYIGVHRFKNVDLGRRLAAETLKGFGIAA